MNKVPSRAVAPVIGLAIRSSQAEQVAGSLAARYFAKTSPPQIRSAGPTLLCLLSIAGGCITTAVASIPLADVKSIDSTIVVELRYAGPNNLTRRALYPSKTRAMIRPELLPRLQQAHRFLRQFDYRLKIWDAYRPVEAQRALWQAVANEQYVANPDLGAGSLHSWGVAVDCTLADLHDRAVQMPSDFDDFSPAAVTRYSGSDPVLRTRLQLLRVAMAAAGFYAFRNEWWHFTAKNWADYLPPAEVERITRIADGALPETRHD
jgi:D-alanyl-D-alanine dipeptidase